MLPALQFDHGAQARSFAAVAFTVIKLPALQFDHGRHILALVAAENVLLGHGAQALSLLAVPFAVIKLPALQVDNGTHILLSIPAVPFGAELYFPWLQTEQELRIPSL